MSELRKITREEILIKARMHAEGVRIDIPGLSDYMDKLKTLADEEAQDFDVNDADSIFRALVKSEMLDANNLAMGSCVIFDGCRIGVQLCPNPSSSISVTLDEGKVVISERGEVLTTGTFKKAGKTWADLPMSNGKPASSALYGFSEGVINILISYSCNNMNTKRGCRYCNLFANPVARKINHLPLGSLAKLAKFQAEAVKLATDHGWRGVLALTGGALPRSERPNYMEKIETVLNIIRSEIGDKTYSHLNVCYNHYPPEDFSDMLKWKKLGVNSTSIDLEVMDSDRFAEICPGKNAYKPLEYWKEAQIASVDVFGPMISTTSCIVVGMEPMSSLLEGVDERLRKGVLPIPLVFQPAPGSVLADNRPPSVEWIMEASDKLTDIYSRYVPRFIASILIKLGKRFLGITNGGLPAGQDIGPSLIMVDEMVRRYQEMSAMEKLKFLTGFN